MQTSPINMKGFESIKDYLRLFNPLILEAYKSEPDKYEILFDEYKGELRTKESYYYELEKKGQTDDYVSIRFGRIKLLNGDASLIILDRELLKSSQNHRDKWLGFMIRNPRLNLRDPNFIKWYSHSVEAQITKNGPIYELAKTIKKINHLTNKSVGKSIYRYELDISLPFPNAENTHKYQESHQELYRYLLDGLNKDCINDIAIRLDVDIKSGDKTTFNSLLKLFPRLENTIFESSMNKVSNQRRLASHHKRNPAKAFGAFEQFRMDLIDCNNGIKELIRILEPSI